MGEQVNYTIRPCETIEDFASCVQLQKKIWGYSDHEIYPVRMFLNVPRTGGHVLGAFAPDGAMAGFVVSIPAWRKKQEATIIRINDLIAEKAISEIKKKTKKRQKR